MIVKAKDLIFISRIIRDGSGIIPVEEKSKKILQEDKYIDIASGFNSYVVKLIDKKKLNLI